MDSHLGTSQSTIKALVKGSSLYRRRGRVVGWSYDTIEGILEGQYNVPQLYPSKGIDLQMYSTDELHCRGRPEDN